jgi:hypothetical protein
MHARPAIRVLPSALAELVDVLAGLRRAPAAAPWGCHCEDLLLREGLFVVVDRRECRWFDGGETECSIVSRRGYATGEKEAGCLDGWDA